MNTLYALDEDTPIETMTAQIEFLPYPTLIVDNGMKVTAKNSKASYKMLSIRKGSGIKRLMNGYDYEKIRDMKPGDIESSEINADERVMVLVIRYVEYYLICFRIFTAALNRRLNEIDRFEQKRLGVSAINGVTEKLPGDKTLITVRTKKILRYQLHMTKLIKILNAVEDETLSVFDATEALNFFIKTATDTIKGLKLKSTAWNDQESIIECRLGDFYIALGTIFSICFRHSKDALLRMQRLYTENRLGIIISAESNLSEEILQLLFHDDYDNIPLESESELLLDVLLLRQLAIHNNWYFKIRSDGATHGRAQYMIFFPLTDKAVIPLLRSSIPGYGVYDEYKEVINEELFIGIEADT